MAEKYGYPVMKQQRKGKGGQSINANLGDI